jgi:hypothetical protein
MQGCSLQAVVGAPTAPRFVFEKDNTGGVGGCGFALQRGRRHSPEYYAYITSGFCKKSRTIARCNGVTGCSPGTRHTKHQIAARKAANVAGYERRWPVARYYAYKASDPHRKGRSIAPGLPVI